MTDLQAQAQNAAHPHLSLETIAYSAGRNAADFGGACHFNDAGLVAAWKRGLRSAKAEDSLSADSEWDGDNE